MLRQLRQHQRRCGKVKELGFGDSGFRVRVFRCLEFWFWGFRVRQILFKSSLILAELKKTPTHPMIPYRTEHRYCFHYGAKTFHGPWILNRPSGGSHHIENNFILNPLEGNLGRHPRRRNRRRTHRNLGKRPGRKPGSIRREKLANLKEPQ